MKRFSPDERDRYLALNNPKSSEYPFYTDLQWRRRDARHPTTPLFDGASGLPRCVINYLADSLFQENLNALQLHPLERGVAEMRSAGCSIREIARAAGVTKWAVEQALRVIRRRLRARQRIEQSGWHGWQEVYLAETRRRGR